MSFLIDHPLLFNKDYDMEIVEDSMYTLPQYGRYEVRFIPKNDKIPDIKGLYIFDKPYIDLAMYLRKHNLLNEELLSLLDILHDKAYDEGFDSGYETDASY
jgi:hypothetical protein